MMIEDVDTIEKDIKRYRAILEKDSSSIVFAPLAELLRRTGSLDEALTMCVEGLQRHPNHISGKVALGRIYYDKGMMSEANKEIEEVIKLSPDNILAEKLHKDILEKIREKEDIGGKEAVEKIKTDEGATVIAAQTPVEKGEAAVIHTVTMAELLEKQGHYEEALKVYEEILKMEEENALINERIEKIRSLLKAKKSDNNIKEDSERLKLLSTWASKFKKGGTK